MSMEWVSFCLQLKSCWSLQHEVTMFWNVETLHLPGRQGRCGPVQLWQQSSGQQPGLSSSLLISLHSFAEPESSAAREPWSSTCGKWEKVDVDVRWRCDEISCHRTNLQTWRWTLNEKWRPSWQKNKNTIGKISVITYIAKIRIIMF